MGALVILSSGTREPLGTCSPGHVPYHYSTACIPDLRPLDLKRKRTWIVVLPQCQDRTALINATLLYQYSQHNRHHD